MNLKDHASKRRIADRGKGYKYLEGMTVSLPGHGKQKIYEVERANKNLHILRTSSGKEFNLEALVRNGWVVPEKPAPRIISESEYEATLQDVMSSAYDDGMGEYTADMAETLFYQPEIREYLQANYPHLGARGQKEQLQTDLENQGL